MIRWLLGRQIAAFEKEWDYDMGYAREILDASPRALMRFARVMALARHREDAPLDAWYAAKLVGTLHEDCGPCTQLVVDMATRHGVAPATIRAVLAGQPEAMPPDVALAWRFARATLAHDLAAAELRDEILRRWGSKALVSLAFAVTSARLFPTLKYALGHGHACTRVRVGNGEALVPAAAAR
jgi:hypothetical protein